MPIDFRTKQIFLIDLDDTILRMTEATEWGIRRAYNRLCTEYSGPGDLRDFLSFKEFRDDIDTIYKKGDESGKPFRDIEVPIVEKYCTENLPKKNLSFNHYLFALAARLFWDFRDGKNGALLPFPDAYELFHEIRGYGFAYCVTEGNCNYQHTKIMRTGLENEFQDIIVIREKKDEELKNYICPLVSEKNPKTTFVMIGDRPSDILAGYNAGIDTVRIRAGGHKCEPDKVTRPLTN